MIVVGIGEYAITNTIEETIITHALGSCVAVIIYCGKNKYTAMAHVVLPKPTDRTNMENYKMKPGYFATDIVPKLLRYFTDELECKKNDLEVYIVGGADSMQEEDVFFVGKKNVAMVRHLLNTNGIRTYASDTGGNLSRTVSIQCSDGHVFIKRQNMIL